MSRVSGARTTRSNELPTAFPSGSPGVFATGKTTFGTSSTTAYANGNSSIVINRPNGMHAIQLTNEQQNELYAAKLFELHHSKRCLQQDKPHCKRDGCSYLQNMLIHMPHCRDGLTCTVYECVASKQIGDHWNNCTAPECKICGPCRRKLRIDEFPVEGAYQMPLPVFGNDGAVLCPNSASASQNQDPWDYSRSYLSNSTESRNRCGATQAERDEMFTKMRMIFFEKAPNQNEPLDYSLIATLTMMEDRIANEAVNKRKYRQGIDERLRYLQGIKKGADDEAKHPFTFLMDKEAPEGNAKTSKKMMAEMKELQEEQKKIMAKLAITSSITVEKTASGSRKLVGKTTVRDASLPLSCSHANGHFTTNGDLPETKRKAKKTLPLPPNEVKAERPEMPEQPFIHCTGMRVDYNDMEDEGLWPSSSGLPPSPSELKATSYGVLLLPSGVSAPQPARMAKQQRWHARASWMGRMDAVACLVREMIPSIKSGPHEYEITNKAIHHAQTIEYNVFEECTCVEEYCAVMARIIAYSEMQWYYALKNCNLYGGVRDLCVQAEGFNNILAGIFRFAMREWDIAGIRDAFTQENFVLTGERSELDRIVREPKPCPADKIHDWHPSVSTHLRLAIICALVRMRIPLIYFGKPDYGTFTEKTKKDFINNAKDNEYMAFTMATTREAYMGHLIKLMNETSSRELARYKQPYKKEAKQEPLVPVPVAQ